MRIACPKCSAQYEVPPAMIGGGKDVRCARCRAIWHVGTEQPPPEPAATPRVAEAVGETAAATHVPYAAVPTLSAVAPNAAAEPASTPSPEPFAPAPEVLAPATAPALIAATTGLVSVDWDKPMARAEGMSFSDRPAMADYIRDIRVERRGIAPVLAAWALSLAVVAGGLAAAYYYRVSVMDSWPPSQRLYTALGITR